MYPKSTPEQSQQAQMYFIHSLRTQDHHSRPSLLPLERFSSKQSVSTNFQRFSYLRESLVCAYGPFIAFICYQDENRDDGDLLQYFLGVCLWLFTIPELFPHISESFYELFEHS